MRSMRTEMILKAVEKVDQLMVESVVDMRKMQAMLPMGPRGERERAAKRFDEACESGDLAWFFRSLRDREARAGRTQEDDR